MSKGKSSGPGGVSLSQAPLPDILKAVADRTRLEILRVLAREAKNVSALTDELGLATSTVSRHAGYLNAFGLYTAACAVAMPLLLLARRLRA